MGDSREEYGTINDLAYTSSHGHLRSPPGAKANPAEKIAARAAARKAKAEYTKAKKVRKEWSSGTQGILC